ncbi:hypothetical protein pah_c022o046 [Parachlamydia acanthamoebae str. Hall's coccus]|nr:hypothetical protein pah_c022o046 [Parachlamydia acanthamoebae str. Hall's coccus]
MKQRFLREVTCIKKALFGFAGSVKRMIEIQSIGVNYF